ncbi:hypothetical protein NLJ89_g4109 [Agrocybe chaxingu]|uniref:Uncharacterized protein n=1 Tax=Agrocybe chaxingu TaxID=84603 RepID=A0A9W8K2R2_9AGAR|nr:hypothetical protein NLJ89_g4109 [Agrocybe chaxingu]
MLSPRTSPVRLRSSTSFHHLFRPPALGDVMRLWKVVSSIASDRFVPEVLLCPYALHPRAQMMRTLNSYLWNTREVIRAAVILVEGFEPVAKLSKRSATVSFPSSPSADNWGALRAHYRETKNLGTVEVEEKLNEIQKFLTVRQVNFLYKIWSMNVMLHTDETGRKIAIDSRLQLRSKPEVRKTMASQIPALLSSCHNWHCLATSLGLKPNQRLACSQPAMEVFFPLQDTLPIPQALEPASVPVDALSFDHCMVQSAELNGGSTWSEFGLDGLNFASVTLPAHYMENPEALFAEIEEASSWFSNPDLPDVHSTLNRNRIKYHMWIFLDQYDDQANFAFLPLYPLESQTEPRGYVGSFLRRAQGAWDALMTLDFSLSIALKRSTSRVMYLAHNMEEGQFVLDYVASRARAATNALLNSKELSLGQYEVWRMNLRKEIRSAACVYGLCGFRKWEVQLDPIISGLSVLFMSPAPDDLPTALAQIGSLPLDTSPESPSKEAAAYECSWWDDLNKRPYEPVKWTRSLSYHLAYFGNADS